MDDSIGGSEGVAAASLCFVVFALCAVTFLGLPYFSYALLCDLSQWSLQLVLSASRFSRASPRRYSPEAKTFSRRCSRQARICHDRQGCSLTIRPRLVAHNRFRQLCCTCIQRLSLLRLGRASSPLCLWAFGFAVLGVCFVLCACLCSAFPLLCLYLCLWSCAAHAVVVPLSRRCCFASGRFRPLESSGSLCHESLLVFAKCAFSSPLFSLASPRSSSPEANTVFGRRSRQPSVCHDKHRARLCEVSSALCA